jgi:Flp pilus assembly pilin Flp
MRNVQSRFNSLLADESGAEVLEYVIIAGLIVVAAIAVITAVGNTVPAR